MTLLPCGHEMDWDHYLFGDLASTGCPDDIPPLPNRCCGITDEVSRPCPNGRCTEFWCAGCGTTTHTSLGPVGCRCDERWRRGHGSPGEWLKIPTLNGREYTRRQRARTKGRR